jgi:hypothetical protein
VLIVDGDYDLDCFIKLKEGSVEAELGRRKAREKWHLPFQHQTSRPRCDFSFSRSMGIHASRAGLILFDCSIPDPRRVLCLPYVTRAFNHIVPAPIIH